MLFSLFYKLLSRFCFTPEILEPFFNTLYDELDYAFSENYVVGKYDCKGVDSDSNKYLITLNLNENGTFLYGPYENTKNNYANGTYTY